jgi:hypothetical protein
MICSCEAARANENEAMIAIAAQNAVARPRHALSRLDMRFPSQGKGMRLTAIRV